MMYKSTKPTFDKVYRARLSVVNLYLVFFCLTKRGAHCNLLASLAHVNAQSNRKRHGTNSQNLSRLGIVHLDNHCS